MQHIENKMQHLMRHENIRKHKHKTIKVLRVPRITRPQNSVQ